jgi:hypothetical protein
LLASFFLGWVISSVILFMLFKVQADQSRHPMAYQGVAIGLMFIAYALPPTLIAAPLWGSSWLKHASQRGLRSKWTSLFAGLTRGAAVGAMSCAVILGPLGVAWWSFAVIGIPYSAAIGAFTGILAWLDLRPDRDAATNPVSTTP